MTFVRKYNGKTERPAESNSIVACYVCSFHGGFDREVERDGRGEAPDLIACGSLDCFCDPTEPCTGCQPCAILATWTPTPVACRVRRIEAVKGKWEPPARPTYLDTRELGEGMDMEDFQAKRAAVWERKRQEDVMAVKKGFG